MIKLKQKGARRELELKKILGNHNYCVTKSGGSFGVFDLISINRDKILLIQVKSNSISKKEREEIIKFSNHPTNCHKIIAIKKDRKNWILQEADQLLNKIFDAKWLYEELEIIKK